MEASDEDQEEQKGLPQLSATALWECITQDVALSGLAGKGIRTAEQATLSGECFAEMAVADKVLTPVDAITG